MCQSAFDTIKALLKLIGIRTARFGARMEESGVAIRLYRFRDLTALYSLCKPELFLKTIGVQLNAFGSLASFWRWIRTTFQVFYVIEVEESNKAYRIIGFVGIYNIELSESLWVSLVIFDPKDRRRGYGQRTL